MKRVAALACVACVACGPRAGDEDGGTDAGAPFDAAFDGDVGPPPDAGGPCAMLCGAVASPSVGAGTASFAPPGCGAGSSRLAWAYDLPVTEPALAIPSVADLDGDGRADLIVGARGVESAMLFAGQDDGRFADTPSYLSGAGAALGGFGGDLGDVDGDGAPDLVAGDRALGALAWRNADGAWVFDASGLPPGAFGGAGLADLDGDGDLDAVFGADEDHDGLALALGDGAGGFTTTGAAGLPAYDSGSALRGVGTISFTDLDRDEDLDVVAFASGARASVFRYDGATTFTPIGDFGGSGTGVAQGSVGDVDCDGLPDIAAGGTVLGGDGTSFTERAHVDDATVAHLGDLDGDGALDLVTHSVAGGLRAYLNAGGASFVEAGLGLPDEGYVPRMRRAFGIDLADVDLDGDLDVVRAYQTDAGARLELWVRD